MKGKEDVTGYVYEPWHIRYVGIDIAEDVAKQDDAGGIFRREQYQAVAAKIKP